MVERFLHLANTDAWGDLLGWQIATPCSYYKYHNHTWDKAILDVKHSFHKMVNKRRYWAERQWYGTAARLHFSPHHLQVKVLPWKVMWKTIPRWESGAPLPCCVDNVDPLWSESVKGNIPTSCHAQTAAHDRWGCIWKLSLEFYKGQNGNTCEP